MAFKFPCNTCGEYIIVRFLKLGEAAQCRNCGANTQVPESAEHVNDEAAIEYQSRPRRHAEVLESAGLTEAIVRRERKIFYWGCAGIFIGATLLTPVSYGTHYWITAEECRACVNPSCDACVVLNELASADDRVLFRVLFEKYYSWIRNLGILAYIVLTARFAIKLKLHWTLRVLYPICAWFYAFLWLVPFIMLYFHSRWLLERFVSDSFTCPDKAS